MTLTLDQLIRQLPKPDPDEELRVRAVDLAGLLDLALDLADSDPWNDLDDENKQLLDRAGDYLRRHAPVTGRWHSERRRVLDGWGQHSVEADQDNNPGAPTPENGEPT